MPLDPAGLEAAAKLARSCTPTAREDARLAEQIVRAYLAATPDPPKPPPPLVDGSPYPIPASAVPAASPDERLREALAALPQYVITIQDREGYTYERGCAGQPMNYTGVMLADVEALVGRELKYDAPVARETTDELKDAHRPWPIAPDTVMPPRRQPVRWGSRADDPPTEIHNDPQTTKAYLAGLAAGRTEAAASPDERLREALRDANEYLVQIADYSPSEVADAIDSVRAQIKDALAATESRGKPDGASVPDQTCATCGGTGDRNGNRRAADPFGTCPGCGGTGNVAAADREAPEPTGCCLTCRGTGHVGGCHGCAAEATR